VTTLVLINKSTGPAHGSRQDIWIGIDLRFMCLIFRTRDTDTNPTNTERLQYENREGV